MVLLALINCSGGNMEEANNKIQTIEKASQSKWKALVDKRIFFGHQSVGYNIVDGINNYKRENKKPNLDIKETTDIKRSKNGLFAHYKIGKNMNPKSKISDFKKIILEDDNGKNIDIVALKFCYVDITAKTDINKLIDDYDKMVIDIKNKYPKIKFIHFTVPLTETKTTWKTWIKKIVGKKEIWEYDNNINRNRYNELLIKKYKGKDSIFDIATIESTFPDNKRCTFKKNGKSYYSLVPQYTDDGGHLNQFGKKIVSEHLLLTLLNMTS